MVRSFGASCGNSYRLRRLPMPVLSPLIRVTPTNLYFRTGKLSPSLSINKSINNLDVHRDACSVLRRAHFPNFTPSFVALTFFSSYLFACLSWYATEPLLTPCFVVFAIVWNCEGASNL